MARRRLRPAITAWTSARTVAEILELADAAHVPASPVGNGAVLPELEHLRARDTWVENPAMGFLQPRVPYRLSVSPVHPFTAAPGVGDDTAAVLAEPAGRQRPPRAPTHRRPLDGMRVFDLTTYWAGPYASQIFGWLGAEVIKVESVQRPDGTRMGTAYATKGPEPWEEAPLFHGANTGKRDITLDMTREQGQALARRLLERCDVFVENFTPRVVERFGILDDDLLRACPGLVVARMPAWGLTGPWRDRPGFAQNMEQVTGLAWITGYRDGPPVVPRGPCDPMGGLHAAFAVLACLWVRERTGIAQTIEAPLVDAAVNVAAQQVIDYSARGYLWERAGNRGPLGAPQGIYKCVKNEAWLALSIENDAQWVALCDTLGRRDWRKDARFATDDARRAHHDELDGLLGEALSRRELEATVGALLSVGVPVAQVMRPEEVSTNPQLRARGFFETLRHPAAGKVAYPGFGARSATRVEHKAKLHSSPPPLLGQHNREVLRRPPRRVRRGARGARTHSGHRHPPRRPLMGTVRGVTVNFDQGLPDPAHFPVAAAAVPGRDARARRRGCAHLLRPGRSCGDAVRVPRSAGAARGVDEPPRRPDDRSCRGRAGQRFHRRARARDQRAPRAG